jgi:hypothetical protein
VAVAGGSTQL